MAWTNSKMFREWPAQMAQVSGTGYTGLDSDTVKAALYDNDITPDNNASVGLTAYGTGQWVAAGNEVVDTLNSNWTAGGRTLASKTFSTATAGTMIFDAADTAGGGTLTITNAYGCLVYDDTITGGTVADQGVCFNYFGGAQSVTSGTFTIVWSVNGIFNITV